MYNLCSQHLQSLNSVQKTLCSTAAQRYVPDAPPDVIGRLGFASVTALIRPELPRLLSVGLLQGQGV